MLKVQNLLYRHILNIPSLHVRPETLTCILGESGSGKTTLLKIFNRLLTPQSGTVTFMGKNLEDYSPVELRRMLPMLPQVPVIFPGSIEDNLLMGLRFAGGGRAYPDRKRMEELLEVLRIGKRLDDAADVLSGGEKQRLAVARLILMDTQAALLDEPSAALDDNTEDAVLSFLLSLVRNEGKTLVVVTHSRRMAEACADDIILLEKAARK